ncbi:MAG: hypothetical protein AB7R67_18935 [Vicinamibacterales bacterium]
MIALRIEGGDRLAATLRELPSRVSTRVLRDGLRTAVAPPIQQRAAALARRAQGDPDLADHIVISTGRGDAQTAAMVVGPSTDRRSDQPSRSFAMQGRYLEFGTAFISMFAFLRPAFESEAPGTLKRLAAEMWDALTRKGFTSTRPGGGAGGGGLL